MNAMDQETREALDELLKTHEEQRRFWSTVAEGTRFSENVPHYLVNAKKHERYAKALVAVLETFDKPQPLSYVDRMRSEKAELDVRRQKLGDFLKGDVYPRLDGQEQCRLLDQFVAMNRYAEILGERLALA